MLLNSLHWFIILVAKQKQLNHIYINNENFSCLHKKNFLKRLWNFTFRDTKSNSLLPKSEVFQRILWWFWNGMMGAYKIWTNFYKINFFLNDKYEKYQLSELYFYWKIYQDTCFTEIFQNQISDFSIVKRRQSGVEVVKNRRFWSFLCKAAVNTSASCPKSPKFKPQRCHTPCWSVLVM